MNIKKQENKILFIKNKSFEQIKSSKLFIF